jgi:hypothetical protein
VDVPDQLTKDILDFIGYKGWDKSHLFFIVKHWWFDIMIANYLIKFNVNYSVFFLAQKNEKTMKKIIDI